VPLMAAPFEIIGAAVMVSRMAAAPGMAQVESKTFKVRTPDGVVISAQEWR
jgi:hypothetical protein